MNHFLMTLKIEMISKTLNFELVMKNKYLFLHYSTLSKWKYSMKNSRKLQHTFGKTLPWNRCIHPPNIHKNFVVILDLYCSKNDDFMMKGTMIIISISRIYSRLVGSIPKCRHEIRSAILEQD